MAAINNPIYNKVVYCDKNVKDKKGKKDDVNQVSELAVSKKVTSIKESADSLANSNNVQHKDYNFVMICGHAGPGLQGLGSNRSAEYRPGKDIDSDHLDDIAAEINTIANSLNTAGPVKPVLFLAGCRAGFGQDGTHLLTRLSSRLPNVLVVASVNYLSFKQVHFSKKLVSVEVVKVIDQNPSNMPVDFKFAINGRLIADNAIQAQAGVNPEVLRGELVSINNVN